MNFRMIYSLILLKFLEFDYLSYYEYFISKFWSDQAWVVGFNPLISDRQIKMNKRNELRQLWNDVRL